MEEPLVPETRFPRMAACFEACRGLPDLNGVITMVADMKTAILTNDPQLLAIVRQRLQELETEDHWWA